MIDVHSYDTYIVAFSGGKDSIACLLHLLDQGVPTSKIELWHSNIDGNPDGDLLMDWACTEGYCRAIAKHFGIPIYFNWKEGGFEREMLRENSLTAPITFEDKDHILRTIGGVRGTKSTRRKFPQVSANLAVRWCSAYLKIDTCSAAIRHQLRFRHSRTLVLSGERGEESKARSLYETFEPDRADCRSNKRLRRHVDRWRPIKDWLEDKVWAIMEKYGIDPHPAYKLGFSRVSCLFCIFANADQAASAHHVDPKRGTKIIGYEKSFGCTIKRNVSLEQLVNKGKTYDGMANAALLKLARSKEYYEPVYTDNWELPAGAYGDGCGPT